MKYLVGLGQIIRGDDGVGLHLIEYVENNYNLGQFKTVDLSNNIWGLLPLLHKTTEMILIVDCSYMGKLPGDYAFFSYKKLHDEKVLEANEIDNEHVTGLKQFIETARQADYHIPPIMIMGIQPDSIDYSVELSERINELLPQYASLAVDYVL